MVFVTGFGKFGNILENPTTKISNALPRLLKEKGIANLTLAKQFVVTVAIEDCDSVLQEIYETIQNHSQYSTNKQYLVIHFGVYKGCGSFRIECQGKNIKNFFIPDERGNKPLDQCIDENCAIKSTI